MAAVAPRRLSRSRLGRGWLGASLLVVVAASASPALGVSLLPLNTPPVTLPDAYVTTMGRELNVSIALGVLANDVDLDGDQLKARDDDSRPPHHGELNLDNEGSLRYRPDDGFTGIDTFGYFAEDDDSKTPGLVTITVLPLATPAPTKPPDPTPKPTPTSTPVPTAAPTLLPSLLPTALPTLLPTRPPTPSPTGTPDPSATPTPGSTGTPPPTPASTDPPSGSPRPTADATGRPAERPTPSRAPEPAAAGGGGGSPPPELTIPVGRPGGNDAGQPRDVEVSGGSLVFSGGVFEWAVPGVVLAVPGLLVLLAVALQVVAGAVWLPVARRRLGADGVRDRRS